MTKEEARSYLLEMCTTQFDVEITDELLAEGILSDEEVIEQLKERIKR